MSPKIRNTTYTVSDITLVFVLNCTLSIDDTVITFSDMKPTPRA